MTELNNIVSTQSPSVNFSYGKHLKKSNKAFAAGTIYFDTAKQQIWYDDPTGTESSHVRISAKNVEIIGSSVDDLPTEGYYHNDIVILKTLISQNPETGEELYQRTGYIYDEDLEIWKPLTEKVSSDELYFVDDIVITEQTTIPTKGKSLTEFLKDFYTNALPKIGKVTLDVEAWVNNEGIYSQEISLSYVTETSIVDLQPSPSQLAVW